MSRGRLSGKGDQKFASQRRYGDDHVLGLQDLIWTLEIDTAKLTQ
jgi:hypothetical protein